MEFLRDKHRKLLDQNSAEMHLRTQRSINWLCRAAALVEEDPDKGVCSARSIVASISAGDPGCEDAVNRLELVA